MDTAEFFDVHIPNIEIGQNYKFDSKNAAKRRYLCEILLNVKHNEVIIFPLRFGIFSANIY